MAEYRLYQLDAAHRRRLQRPLHLRSRRPGRCAAARRTRHRGGGLAENPLSRQRHRGSARIEAEADAAAPRLLPPAVTESDAASDKRS